MPKEGPILTPMPDVPGNPKDFKGDSGDCHDGIPGMPPGTGGKAPEVTYVEDDAWSKVPRADYKQE